MALINSREVDGILVLGFAESKILDETKIQRIGNELLEGAKQAKSDGKLVLNFRGVAFMSSAMIGKLVLLNKKCKGDEIDLKICEISTNVMEVFKIMKLNKVFDIHKTEEKALKAFEKKGWFG